MANPVKTTLPAKVWTKVATNVTTGKVAVQDNAKVYYTYVTTASPPPTDNSTAVPIRGGEVTIAAGAASDVYCKAVDGSSVVFFS